MNMNLCFTLSMPGRNSWNGRWSGEDALYAKVLNFRGKKDVEKARSILETGYYDYNFGDGWRAGISIKEVDPKESARIRRKSAGFNGYDWMVESIVEIGVIKTRTQRAEEAQG
jgi:hypothetical protein